jgi:hypothetical protein
MLRTRTRLRNGSVPWYLSSAFKADGTSPALHIDFANQRYAVNSVPRSFSDIFTFSRESTKTRIGPTGLIETVASGSPAFDYDPVTGAAKGISIEGQRTNLNTYSAPTSGQWSATRSTSTYNSGDAPNGTTTAVVNSPNAGTGASYFHGPALAYTSGTTYSLSCFVRAGTNNRIQLTGASAVFGSSQYANFLLSGAGSVSASAGCTAGIQQAANGWYRIWIIVAATATASGHSGALTHILTGSDGRVPSLTFAGTESIYAWGAQVEAGSFPSSYIPTSGSAGTRLADNVTNTSSNTVPFADWYNQSEGAVLAKFKGTGGDESYPRIYEIGGGTTQDRITTNLAISTRNIEMAVFDGGAFQASRGSPITGLSNSAGALAYKENDFAFSINGDSPTLGTSGTLPTVDRMSIGRQNDTTAGYIFGHIKELRYYPARVSNSELARITT